MSRSCNSTENGRFMGVEHGFKALAQPVPKIIPNLVILAVHETHFGHLAARGS